MLDHFGPRTIVLADKAYHADRIRELNILLLAKNAGTSVEQLQRFYLSHVDASVQMDDLHRTKKGLTFR